MNDLQYEPTAADRRIYEEELAPWLPETLIDIHSHLAPPWLLREPSTERKQKMWMLRLPLAQSAEPFMDAYEQLFPGERIEAVLAFAMPVEESDLAGQNLYLRECADHISKLRTLYCARPEATETELEQALQAGHLGFKPYPDLARTDHPGEERIAEFLTPAMCDVADRHGSLVMLHIAGKRRLADPENIRDLLDLAQRWPRLRLVVAHLGRSYNPYYLEEGLRLLGNRCPWHYDFSAVTNPEVMQLGLERIPHERLCFGLDLPITLARGYYTFPSPESYTVHIEGYNLEPRSAQPPLAYQVLRAFGQAAARVSLSRDSLDKIFHQNARMLIANQRDQL